MYTDTAKGRSRISQMVGTVEVLLSLNVQGTGWLRGKLTRQNEKIHPLMTACPLNKF